MGGSCCAAMNAANEEAVALYLQDRLRFYDISDAVEAAMELPVRQTPTLEEILSVDAAARELVRARFG